MEPAPDNPVTVEGYSPRYRAAVDRLLGIEGGYVNDASDAGGATKYGISLRFLAADGAFDEDHDGKADFDLDMDGDIDAADIRKLTLGDARYLYLRCFWRPLECETHARPIGEMLFDQGVNGGMAAARKLLQQALNICTVKARTAGATAAPAALLVDGALGPKSRAAEDWVLSWPALGMPAIIDAYRTAARDRYRAIVRRYPSQQKYLRGWLARAEGLGRS